MFGPIMIVWFATLATLGVLGIARAPQVLIALNPVYAITFLATHGALGFFSLGAVVLVVTGAEALYADMGHFGSAPIRIAWSFLVFPALALNYFGQGALLIVDPKSVENPFYLLAPSWALYPLVGARDGGDDHRVAGGDLRRLLDHAAGDPARLRAADGGIAHVEPRNRARSTCPASTGRSSWVSSRSCSDSGRRRRSPAPTASPSRGRWRSRRCSRSSSRAGYGIGISSLCVALFGAFLIVDLGFFSANIVKIVEGGWFPLAFGFGVFVLMSTWKLGRELLFASIEADSIPLPDLHRERVARLHDGSRHRGIHDVEPGGGAACAAAQPEALQEPARARRSSSPS